MERISIKDLRPGMIVGHTIVANSGRPLFIKNTMLSEPNIEQVKSTGVKTVYIKRSLADIVLPQTVSNKVFEAVEKNLKQIFDTVKSRRGLNMKVIRRSTAILVEEVSANPDILITMEEMCDYGEYLFNHCINVAILSLMTGISMGYSEGTLMELGTGALLHDIGMTFVDPQIVYKPGALSTYEMSLVRQHTEVGYNILKTAGEFAASTPHIAFQHHERSDGTGYPRGLDKEKIADSAKIVAMADVFEALASDRPYRKGHTLDECIYILEKLEGTYFESDLLNVFMSNIAAYPIGTLVKLTNNQIAVVMSDKQKVPQRPMVTVVLDDERNVLNPAVMLDLGTNPEVSIAKKLSKAEARVIVNLLENTDHTTEIS
ncbi:MAG: HD domain-containing phosphohydrolase [Candidatus Saccharibacteria bacterium]